MERIEFDLTPEIYYNKRGKPIAVKEFCNVNGRTRAESTYKITPEGTFTESHFDEHHGIYSFDVSCTRERLAESDKGCKLSTLAVLESPDRKTVERLVQEAGVEVKHIQN